MCVADIAAIRSERNYTHVVNASGKDYPVRVPLQSWRARLPADAFMLLDRSLLINRSHFRRCVLNAGRAELFLGNIAQPFLLGRMGLRRFKEHLLPLTP